MKRAVLLLIFLIPLVSAAYFSSIIVSEVYLTVLSPKVNSTIASVDLGSLKAGESFSKEVYSELEIRDAVALNITLKVSEQSDLNAISDLSVYAVISNKTKTFEGYLPLSIVLSEGKYNVSLKITGRAGYPNKDTTAKIIIVAEAKEPFSP